MWRNGISEFEKKKKRWKWSCLDYEKNNKK